MTDPPAALDRIHAEYDQSCEADPDSGGRGESGVSQEHRKDCCSFIRILEWNTNAAAGECREEDEGHDVLNDYGDAGELDVQDIEVGEEACG